MTYYPKDKYIDNSIPMLLLGAGTQYYPKDKYIDNSIGRDFIKEVVPVHTGTIIDFAGGWPSAPKRPI